MVSHTVNVLTPAHCFLKDINELETLIQEMQFPMIVKHFNGYGSVGMH